MTGLVKAFFYVPKLEGLETLIYGAGAFGAITALASHGASKLCMWGGKKVLAMAEESTAKKVAGYALVAFGTLFGGASVVLGAGSFALFAAPVLIYATTKINIFIALFAAATAVGAYTLARDTKAALS
jgi:hypothetical protein